MLEPEADQIDHHLRARTIVLRHTHEDVAQFVHRQVGGVDDQIGQCPDTRHLPALLVDPFGNRSIGRERMRSPGLAESAHQR